MARKPKEVEQEIDLGKQKQKTFSQRWFDEHATNNKEEIKRVCDITSRSCWEQFKIYIPNNTEIFAEVFHATFMSILKFLRDKQSKYTEYSMLIAQSINIGYLNNTNTDNEKVGNFMPFMEYYNVNRSVVDPYDIPYDDAREIRNKGMKIEEGHANRQLMAWKVQNIKQDIENYNKIQQDALQLLLTDDYKVNLRADEAIFPIFCIFMDNVTNVLKMKFRELNGANVSTVSLDCLGLFKEFYSYDEEHDKEVIEFQPDITMKLALKNDEAAEG